MPLPSKEIGILIADDFPTMRKIVKMVFLQLGFTNLVEAEDGSDALKLLKGNRDFGLIVSDCHMPLVSGLELLKAVRAHPRLQGIPFLMITSESDRDHVIEAAQFGLSNYIVKPFSAPDLQAKIDVLFK